MLDIRKLVMLREVAAAGSIAAAARELRYTRSAVSQQLTALQHDAGVALLHRVGNRVALTAAGRALVQHTERILVELRAAEASLDAAASRDGGLLRVGVPFREGPPLMSSALTRARKDHPRLEIRLEATTDESAAEQVLRNHLDLAMVSRYGPQTRRQQPGLLEYALGSDMLMVCLPAVHPLVGQQELQLGELANAGWVQIRATDLGQLVNSLCVAAGFEPLVAASVDDVGTALGLVAIGWGLTIAPQLTPVTPEQSVVRVPLKDLHVERHTVLIVRRGEELSPRVAPVIAAVQDVSRQRIGERKGR